MFTSVLCRQPTVCFSKSFLWLSEKEPLPNILSYLTHWGHDSGLPFFLGTKRKGGKFPHKIVFLRIYSMRTKFLLKLWQNKKGRMFVFQACQNDIFFSAASCKKYIILGSMTNKYSALLISLRLYRFFSKKSSKTDNIFFDLFFVIFMV